MVLLASQQMKNKTNKGGGNSLEYCCNRSASYNPSLKTHSTMSAIVNAYYITNMSVLNILNSKKIFNESCYC